MIFLGVPWDKSYRAIADFVGRAISIEATGDLDGISLSDLFDRMTENISTTRPDPAKMFEEKQRFPLEVIDLPAGRLQCPDYPGTIWEFS